MKFQSIIRKGLVVTGFAAALALLPSTAKSQEITNTEFSDGQYVTALPQPAVPRESVTVRMAVEPSQVAPSNANSVQQTQATVQAPEPSAVVTFLLVICAGLVALYALIMADRSARRMAINRSSYVITRNA